MTAYQLLPGLLPDEYDALRNDIAAHGIRVPVDVDENGQVLDGHHRSLIAAELGIDCPRRTVVGLTEAEKIAHALAVNVHRRSLTREQRRDLLAVSIKAEPEASDREHARRVGTHNETAAAVRAELEASGQVTETVSRIGADGRTRPASQPPRPQTSPPPKPRPTTDGGESTTVDRTTGEITGSVPIEQHPDYHQNVPGPTNADLTTQVYNSIADSDNRFALNLLRGVTSADRGLLSLEPSRTGEALAEDERESVLAFLDRMQQWSDAVRRSLRPHLRSVR